MPDLHSGIRVWEATADISSPYDLAGASTSQYGLRTFVDAGLAAVSVYIMESHQTAHEWQWSRATVTDGSPDTYVINRVIKSSNSDAQVTWTAGTRDVFLFDPHGYSSGPLHTITAATVLDESHHTVMANFSSDLAITLPPVDEYQGKDYTVKSINTSIATVTEDAGDTNSIEQPGGEFSSTHPLRNSGDWVRFRSDGSKWRMLSSSVTAFKIEDYGATPRTTATAATTDSTVAIQAAIDAASAAGGGRVTSESPSGVFAVNAQLTVPSNITLSIGQLYVTKTPALASVLFLSESQDVTICGMSIHGSYATAIKAWGNADGNTDIKRLTICDNLFYGATGLVLDLDALQQVRVLRNRILPRSESVIDITVGEQIPTVGIWVSTTGADDVEIRGNWVYKTSKGGIATNNTIRCEISENYIDEITGNGSNEGYGIQFYKSSVSKTNSNNRAYGNRVTNCDGMGVYNQGSEDTVIENNYFENCCRNIADAGSLVTGAISSVPTVSGSDALGDALSNLVVKGNTIINTQNHGIAYFGRNCAIEGNTIINTEWYAISVRGHRDGSIKNNTFMDNRRDIEHQSGSEFTRVRMEGNTTDLPTPVESLTGTAITEEWTSYDLVDGFTTVVGWSGGVDEQEWDLRMHEAITLTHNDATAVIPMMLEGAQNWTVAAGDYIKFKRTGVKTQATKVGHMNDGTYVDLPNARDGASGTSETVTIVYDEDFLVVGWTRPFRGLALDIGATPNAIAATLTVQFSNGSGSWNTAAAPPLDWTASGDSVNGWAIPDATFAVDGAIRWNPPSSGWATETAVNAPDGSTADLFWCRIAFSASPTASMVITDIEVYTHVMQEISRQGTHQFKAPTDVVGTTLSTFVANWGLDTDADSAFEYNAGVYIDSTGVWFGTTTNHSLQFYTNNEGVQAAFDTDKTLRMIGSIHWGSPAAIAVSQVPSPNTATMDLKISNIQLLNMGLADDAVNLTIKEPATNTTGVTFGRFIVQQNGSVAYDLSFTAGAGITNVYWVGTEPTWTGMGLGALRFIDWTFLGIDLYLKDQGEYP